LPGRNAFLVPDLLHGSTLNQSTFIWRRATGDRCRGLAPQVGPCATRSPRRVLVLRVEDAHINLGTWHQHPQ
jgi:hypothetical protein